MQRTFLKWIIKRLTCPHKDIQTYQDNRVNKDLIATITMAKQKMGEGIKTMGVFEKGTEIHF